MHRPWAYNTYSTVILDKPEYLAPARYLVHLSRKMKSRPVNSIEPEVGDMLPIPHCQTNSSLLSSLTFKAKVIKYMYIAKEVTIVRPVSIIVHSSSLPTIHVTNGAALEYVPNQHGEGDYAIWNHAINTALDNVLVFRYR